MLLPGPSGCIQFAFGFHCHHASGLESGTGLFGALNNSDAGIRASSVGGVDPGGNNGIISSKVGVFSAVVI